MSYSYEFSSSSYEASSNAPQVSVSLGNAERGHRSTVSFAASSDHRSSANSNSVAAQLAAASNCNQPAASFLSEVEAAILRSSVPVEVNESEEITVLGQRGVWANRVEVQGWRGPIPIGEYQINQDADPEIITKRTQQRVEYIQELAVRYLRPPTPPVPGEIIIKQECNTMTRPAPPLIIRQQPPRPSTPEPLVIREAPPQPPPQVNRKVITISGKRLPPPPRKVVIERLAPLPSKPQAAIVERWLPYAQVKRRVIYQRSCEPDQVACKPRNVIVQWEAPPVVVKKEVKYLGVIRANPAEYVQRFGATLKLAKDLPQFVLDIKTPDGLVLAADYQYNNVHELEGDLQAMRLVDLEREGLAEYRNQLQKQGISYAGAEAAAEFAARNGTLSQLASGSLSSTGGGHRNGSRSVIADIFAQVDKDSNGSLSLNEARRLFLLLNSRLGRTHGESELRAFFRALDTDRTGSISLQEFRVEFERLIYS